MICANCSKDFEKPLKANNKTTCCSRNCSLAIWRRNRRDELREYSNDWLHANQERHTAHNRDWRKRRPEASVAQGKLNYAVRLGSVTRKPCEVCTNPKSHAHHDDYSKPLEVRWLCGLHHKEVHMKLKELAL